MPSAAHQSLLLWLTRSMLRDGFSLTGLDGHVEQAGVANRLPLPMQILGIRPDACAYRARDGLLAFAEAKTAHDINTAHTRKQLGVLGATRMREALAPCPLYIAVPRGSAYALDRVLERVGLLGARHVRRIHVPDTLLGS